MSEGGVYLCDKSEKNGKCKIVLVHNKDIEVTGDNWGECEAEIYSKIIEHYGDGEAVLEFIPPKSKKMATGTHLYTSLGYNEDVGLFNKEKLFDAFCKKCSRPIGKRNEVLMDMKLKPKNALVSTKRFGYINIYLNSFIDLFTEDEKALFEIKPVLLKGKISQYVELIPKKIVTHSGHKGADYTRRSLQSWRCSECGREEFSLIMPEIYKYENLLFIKPDDVVGLPSMLFVSDGMHTSLVIRNDRWAELRQHKKETKGIPTNKVVVLEPEYVEYPELEEPEKFEW